MAVAAAAIRNAAARAVARARASGISTQRFGATATADRFVVNYKPVCKGSVDLYFIMWPCVVENHGLSYTSAPLREDVQMVGHPIADLWIAASTHDADVFVYLERITPAGDVSIVTHGRLRASFAASSDRRIATTWACRITAAIAQTRSP